MKKLMLCALACIVLTASAWAADPYKLVLADGTVLMVDQEPTIRDGVATILRGGVEFTLPVRDVDLTASRAANPSATSAGQGGSGAPTGPKKYTDDDLEKLRTTAPLANEGEVRTGGGPAKSPPKGERKPTSDAQLQKLYDQEDRLREDRTQWLNRIAEFQQQYDALVKEQADQDYKYSRQEASSARGAEQEKWRKAQEARKARVQKDVAVAEEKVRELDDDLEEVRRDIYRQYDREP